MSRMSDTEWQTIKRGPILVNLLDIGGLITKTVIEGDKARICEKNLIQASKELLEALDSKDPMALRRAMASVKLAIAQCKE